MPVPVIRGSNQVEAAPVERARGTTMQVLLGHEQGVPSFVTRLLAIAPGGRIPCHRHSGIEHEQVVLSGEMVLILDGEEQQVAAGDAILIPAGVAHAYENRGSEPVRFLCVVPLSDDYATEWLEPPEPG